MKFETLFTLLHTLFCRTVCTAKTCYVVSDDKNRSFKSFSLPFLQSLEISRRHHSRDFAKNTDYGHPMDIKAIWKIGPVWQTKYASAIPKNLGLWLNFSRALKAISSLGVGSPWPRTMIAVLMGFFFQEKCPCRQHKSLSFHIFFCNEK